MLLILLLLRDWLTLLHPILDFVTRPAVDCLIQWSVRQHILVPRNGHNQRPRESQVECSCESHLHNMEFTTLRVGNTHSNNRGNLLAAVNDENSLYLAVNNGELSSFSSLFLQVTPMTARVMSLTFAFWTDQGSQLRILRGLVSRGWRLKLGSRELHASKVIEIQFIWVSTNICANKWILYSWLAWSEGNRIASASQQAILSKPQLEIARPTIECLDKAELVCRPWPLQKISHKQEFHAYLLK